MADEEATPSGFVLALPMVMGGLFLSTWLAAKYSPIFLVGVVLFLPVVVIGVTHGVRLRLTRSSTRRP